MELNNKRILIKFIFLIRVEDIIIKYGKLYISNLFLKKTLKCLFYFLDIFFRFFLNIFIIFINFYVTDIFYQNINGYIFNIFVKSK